ncbi:hypothetical protein [Demequina mangrovi]|uniref:Scaffolding protein n=1 Tax=Demequina mangrovi TaxID=1043493 RepID=A0A1H6YVC4_9MICO|nr:hypothetical protein [Demequina mangrovi]SEJ45169.1 hypothetical protein SAMN05421637_1815 [Demequina mangrovi]
MTTEPTPAPTPADGDKPAPWGEDFDPARAWTLVQNLRAERDAARDEAKQATGALTAARDEAKHATEALATAKASQADAERALWRESALRRHPLPEGLDAAAEADALAFLSGDSAEDVERKAATLAALRGASEVPAPGSDLRTRPEPRLAGVPGHSSGDADPAPTDLGALAAKISAERI